MLVGSWIATLAFPSYCLFFGSAGLLGVSSGVFLVLLFWIQPRYPSVWLVALVVSIWSASVMMFFSFSFPAPEEQSSE